MKKRAFAKLIILVVFAMLAAVSCRGPKECWGVTSDVSDPAVETLDKE